MDKWWIGNADTDPLEAAENDAGPKRCPHCNRVAFRTMTDYLCVSGCGWHEWHDEPIPTRDIPPGSTKDGAR